MKKNEQQLLAAHLEQLSPEDQKVFMERYSVQKDEDKTLILHEIASMHPQFRKLNEEQAPVLQFGGQIPEDAEYYYASPQQDTVQYNHELVESETRFNNPPIPEKTTPPEKTISPAKKIKEAEKVLANKKLVQKLQEELYSDVYIRKKGNTRGGEFDGIIGKRTTRGIMKFAKNHDIGISQAVKQLVGVRDKSIIDSVNKIKDTFTGSTKEDIQYLQENLVADDFLSEKGNKKGKEFDGILGKRTAQGVINYSNTFGVSIPTAIKFLTGKKNKDFVDIVNMYRKPSEDFKSKLNSLEELYYGSNDMGGGSDRSRIETLFRVLKSREMTWNEALSSDEVILNRLINLYGSKK